LVTKGSTGIDGLKRAERDRPAPAVNQVLVRMHAASLNFRDLAVVNGKYIRGPVLHDTIPLSDGAGQIEAVGPGVKDFAAGDRVVATFAQGDPPAALGSPLDGVLAEYAVFDMKGLLRIPDHLSYEEAATLPCAAVTAWNALFVAGGQLKPADTVLTMGTGGVSIFALQMAKAAGARVIITSSSDEKLEHAKRLGADEVINYKRTPDWDKEVMRLTDNRGVDCVVELGGAGTLARSYRSVGFCGRVQFIGVLANNEPGETNPHPLAFKAASVNGVMVGNRVMLERSMQLMATARFKPVIDKVFPLADAQEAFRYLQAGKHFGKVVVTV
jgi:NADPH:quinone reductase-like Zn-dependent oxidoreductase